MISSQFSSVPLQNSSNNNLEKQKKSPSLSHTTRLKVFSRIQPRIAAAILRPPILIHIQNQKVSIRVKLREEIRCKKYPLWKENTSINLWTSPRNYFQTRSLCATSQISMKPILTKPMPSNRGNSHFIPRVYSHQK